MTEHLNHHSPEHESFKAERIEAQTEKVPEHNQEALRHDLQEQVDSFSKEAKNKAESARNASFAEKQTPDAPNYHHASGELKQLGYDRALTRLRKHLSAPERALSKTIHQPAIEALSEASAKTIARPSGLLGGSICAFLGSLLFLMAARTYGFKYNYLLFFSLFIGGFGLGMLIELLVFVARRKHA